jgi:hypothetical protein
VLLRRIALQKFPCNAFVSAAARKALLVVTPSPPKVHTESPESRDIADIAVIAVIGRDTESATLAALDG